MPSTSRKQHNFMLMSQSRRGRARLRAMGRKPADMATAKEFTAADKAKGKFQHRKKPNGPIAKMARAAKHRRRHG